MAAMRLVVCALPLCSFVAASTPRRANENGGPADHFLPGMARDGKYGKASYGQQQAYARLHGHIRTVVRQYAMVPHLAVADFGVADCVAFVQMAKVVLAARPNLSVTFVLVDLPTQDWTACDREVSSLGMGGLQPFWECADLAPGAEIRWREPEQQHVAFCMHPGNFYGQLLPSESIDIALSGTAFQWLSSIHDMPMPKGVFAGDDPSVSEQWVEKARADWETILSKRSEELKSGGKLIASINALESKERLSYYSSQEYHVIFDRLLQQYLNEQLVTEEFVRNLTFGFMYLRDDDLRAGFDSRRVDLTPELIEVITLPHLLWSPQLRENKTMRSAVAETYIDNMLAWTTPLLLPARGVDFTKRLRADLMLEVEAIADALKNGFVVGEVIAIKAARGLAQLDKRCRFHSSKADVLRVLAGSQTTNSISDNRKQIETDLSYSACDKTCGDDHNGENNRGHVSASHCP